MYISRLTMENVTTVPIRTVDATVDVRFKRAHDKVDAGRLTRKSSVTDGIFRAEARLFLEYAGNAIGRRQVDFAQLPR